MACVGRSSSNSTLPPHLSVSQMKRLRLWGAGGMVRDFRVPRLQGQSRAESWISDAKALLPSLPSTPRQAPQHEFSIRNHSKQEPPKGEPPLEPLEHLTMMPEACWSWSVYGLSTLGSLSRVTLHQGSGRTAPEPGGPRWGLRSDDGSQPGKPWGRQGRLSGSSALWEGVPPTAPTQPTGGPSPRQGPHQLKAPGQDTGGSTLGPKHLQVLKKGPPNQGRLGPAGHRNLQPREGKRHPGEMTLCRA